MSTSIARLSATVAGTCNEVLATARELGRDDLASLITTESTRWNESDTTIVVAGEPGTGKTTLIAALCARAELAVDGPTVVYSVIAQPASDEDEHIAVHFDGDAEPQRHPLGELTRFVSGSHNPNNALGVAAVHVALHCELCDAGIVLIDTPGVDRLESRWGALTMRVVERADHLVLTTAADAPLSRPELEFLRQATTRLETVSVAMNRIDRFRGWRTVAGHDSSAIATIVPHLADVEITPIAAQLAIDSLDALNHDDELAAILLDESRIEVLRESLRTGIGSTQRFIRLANLVRSARTVAGDMLGNLVLGGDVTELDRLADRKAALNAEAASLRESSPAWAIALSDDLTMLRDSLSVQMQSESTRLVERIDDAIERGTDDAEFDALVDVEFRLANLELDRWLSEQLDEVAQRQAQRCALDLAAPSSERLDPSVSRSGAPWSTATSTIGLRIAAAVSSTLGGVGMMAVTSVGAIGAQGSDVGIFRLGTLALSVFIGSISAAVGVRHSKKQQRVSAARLAVRSDLDSWRVTASNAARATILLAQRALEAESKALLRDRQASIAAEIGQVDALMAATRSDRDRAAADAQQIQVRLERFESELDTHARSIVEALAARRARTEHR